MALDLQKLNSAIQTAYSENNNLVGGANASYIPYLASVPSKLTGLLSLR